MKRILCFMLSLVLMTSLSVQLFAADASARAIVIFQVDGKDATMTKGTEREFTAKAGLKLFEGYTVSTGTATNVYLKLDDATIVKVDQNSTVSVSKASSTKLSLTTISGAVSVDAAPQKTGDSLEIRAGNSALAVRGTIFVVENRDDGVSYVMFTGGGEVNGVRLDAGNMMTVLDRQSTYTETAIDFSKLSDFSLVTAIENADTIIELGVLTVDQMEDAKEIYEKRTAQQNNITSDSSSNPVDNGSDNPSGGDPSEPSDDFTIRIGEGTYSSTIVDGAAMPIISESALDGIVKNAVDNAVDFVAKDARVSAFNLPANVVARLAENNIEADIMLNDDAVVISQNTIHSINRDYSGQDIQLRIANAHLTEAQKEMVDSNNF